VHCGVDEDAESSLARLPKVRKCRENGVDGGRALDRRVWFGRSHQRVYHGTMANNQL
jgi:hypothetical protein